MDFDVRLDDRTEGGVLHNDSIGSRRKIWNRVETFLIGFGGEGHIRFNVSGRHPHAGNHAAVGSVMRPVSVAVGPASRGFAIRPMTNSKQGSKRDRFFS